MKKLLIIILVLINFVFMQDVGKEWSDEAKATFYLAERLSPETALYYQFASIIPFTNLGYAYTDNWKKGLMWDGAMLGSLILADAILSCPDYDEYCEWGYEDYDNEELSDLLTLTALGIFIFKYINVYQLAEEHNDKLYDRVFGGQRPYFSMEYDAKNKGSILALNIPIGK